MPLAVLFLTAGHWAIELLVIRLQLQEGARFAAWETASYPQADVAMGEGDRRTALVAEAAVDRALIRYADLDPSGSSDVPRGLVARASNVELSAQRLPLTWGDGGTRRLRPDSGGRAALVAAMTRSAGLELPARWGFQGPVAVVATATAAVAMPRLGVQLLGRRSENAGAAHLTLSARHAVVTDSGFLPDGAESTVGSDRTGVHRDGHRSGLYLQVRRMRLLGLEDAFEPERSAATALTALMPLSPPEFDGAFVVDHALGNSPGRPCEGAPGYPGEALSGLRDFGDAVDPGAPRCFGTQPLRDTQEYESSAQLHALRARGPGFMGCPDLGADDPSRSIDEDLTDANVLKQSCGGAR